MTPRRLASVLVAVVLLLASALPATAHGCHDVTSRSADLGVYQKSYVAINASSGNTYDRIGGNYSLPYPIHVESSVGPSTGVRLEDSDSPAVAEMIIVTGTGGGALYWKARVADEDGSGWDWEESGVIYSSTARIDIYREDGPVLDYFKFRINHGQVAVYGSWPLWTAERAEVVAKQGSSGRNQVLGYTSDHFNWTAVVYQRNGQVFEFPSVTPVEAPNGYMQASTGTGKVDFWDSDC